MLLMIGVDRLISVTMPIFYKKVTYNTTYYVLLLCSIAGILPIYLNVIAYVEMTKMPNYFVSCSLPDCFQKKAFDKFCQINALFSILTLLTYSIIWIYIKYKGTYFNKQILRSITVISVFVVSQWTFMVVVQSIYDKLGLNWIRRDVMQLYFGMFINIGVSVNYPIYFNMRLVK